MKNLFTLLFAIMLTSTCSPQDTNYDDISEIRYETYSRGFAAQYVISEDSISVTNGTFEKTTQTRAITKAEWQNLMATLNNLKIQNIETLEPPTEGRMVDAAAQANLSITQNNNVFETKTFDHGNAPAPIEPLVKAILRLAETVE